MKKRLTYILLIASWLIFVFSLYFFKVVAEAALTFPVNEVIKTNDTTNPGLITVPILTNIQLTAPTLIKGNHKYIDNVEWDPAVNRIQAEKTLEGK
jgi:hypothetical protein